MFAAGRGAKEECVVDAAREEQLCHPVARNAQREALGLEESIMAWAEYWSSQFAAAPVDRDGRGAWLRHTIRLRQRPLDGAMLRSTGAARRDPWRNPMPDGTQTMQARLRALCRCFVQVPQACAHRDGGVVTVRAWAGP